MVRLRSGSDRAPAEVGVSTWWRRGVALAVAAILLPIAVAAQGASPSGAEREVDPFGLGRPATITLDEGTVELTVTVREVVDPFEAVQAFQADDVKGSNERLVALRIRAQNDGSEALRGTELGQIKLLGLDSVLYTPIRAWRHDRDMEADPDLGIDDLTAGAEREGLLFYRLPEGLTIQATILAPGSDRMVTIGPTSGLATSAVTDDENELGRAVTFATDSVSLTLSVTERIDPYGDGLSERAAEELDTSGERLLAIRVSLANDGSAELPGIVPRDFRLLGADGVLRGPTKISRDAAQREADPELDVGRLAPGEVRTGLLFYRLPGDMDTAATLYVPRSDRLIPLTSGAPAPPAAVIGSGDDVHPAPRPETDPAPAATPPSARSGAEPPEPADVDETPPTTLETVVGAHGSGIAYASDDGAESFLLSSTEIVDDFKDGLTAFDADRLGAERARYVAVRLGLENTGPDDLSMLMLFNLRLVDAAGVLHTITTPSREADAKAAEPDFDRSDLGPGETRSGLLFFEVPADAGVDAIVFNPPGRLITIPAPGTEDARGPLAGGSTAPDARLEALREAGAYASTEFGHSLEWETAVWDVAEATVSEGRDHLRLVGDAFEFEVEGLVGFHGDSSACVAERVGEDIEAATGFDSPPDGILAPTLGGSPADDAGLYLLVESHADGSSRRLVRYVECRSLTSDSVLRLVVTAPERLWKVDRAAAVSVWRTIVVPQRVDAGEELTAAVGDVVADVPPVTCSTILHRTDLETALDVWGRIRAGLDGDTIGDGGFGETCDERIASDDSVRVFLGPGSAEDFLPGARVGGVPGYGLPGLGDDARIFHVLSSEEPGYSVLSVREERDVGSLFFRVELGRPDLDDPSRIAVLARLARTALERFPGERVPGLAGSADVAALLLSNEPADQALQGYVGNLLAKEEDREWTRGEGLVATLKLLNGEALEADVLRHASVRVDEAGHLLLLASAYLEEGADDTARAEIARLLDALTYSNEELDRMAGLVPAARDGIGGFAAAALSTRPSGRAAPVTLVPASGSRRTALDGGVDLDALCQTFFHGRTSIGVGPCIEWKPVRSPAASNTEYRVFVPHPAFPQGGWEPKHFDWAVEATEHAAKQLEGPISEDLAGIGRGAEMQTRVNIVFSIGPRHDYAMFTLAPSDRSEPCGVEIYPLSLRLKEAWFKQFVAHELAHCFLAVNFPEQVHSGFIQFWWEGLAEHLSNVVYERSDYEWERFESAKALFRGSSLLDFDYEASLFWQFVENRRGLTGVFGVVDKLATDGTRPQQEAAMADVAGIEELFQDFAEKMLAGGVEDTGKHRRSPALLQRQKAIRVHGPIGPYEPKYRPFQFGVMRLEIERCKRANVRIEPEPGPSSSRPVAAGPWRPVPATIPARGTADKDLFYVWTNTVKSKTTFAVENYGDNEADPECIDDSVPPPPVSPRFDFCDVCRASGYYQ